jgi:uncharacterized protein YbjT (DUF2867 family)
MKVILFGATGMVGQGALRECLLDPSVEAVLSIGRRPTGTTHARFREIVHEDLTDYSAIEGQLAGYDACFFCLGISSVGLSEPEYTHITYDLALAAGKALAARNPTMTFIFVSGAGTDSSEKGRSMWARVKGRTENALMQLPFKSYMFRPGFIQPLHGISSKTRLYRAAYVAIKPLVPIFRALAPGSVTTTELIGRAMIEVARSGYSKRILESQDINQAARPAKAA